MLKIKSESAMENIWKRVMEDDIGVLLMLPQINQTRSEIVIISKLLEQGSLKPTKVLAICISQYGSLKHTVRDVMMKAGIFLSSL